MLHSNTHYLDFYKYVGKMERALEEWSQQPDMVSSFSNIGKKTAWDVWHLFPDVSEAFKSL